MKPAPLIGGLLLSLLLSAPAQAQGTPPNYRIQGTACNAGIIPYLNIIDAQTNTPLTQATRPLIVALNCNVSTNSGYDTESKLTIQPEQTLELCNLLRNPTDAPLLNSNLRFNVDQPLDRHVPDYQNKDVLVIIDGERQYTTLAPDLDAVTQVENEVIVRLMPVAAHGYAVICRRVTVPK